LHQFIQSQGGLIPAVIWVLVDVSYLEAGLCKGASWGLECEEDDDEL